MSGVCASCENPKEDDDESLCAACLSNPDEEDAFATTSRALRIKVEVAQLYRAARGALRLARIYVREAATVDARARSCLNEAAACRAQIRALRGNEPAAMSDRPGLRKAQLPAVAADSLRAAR